MAEIVIDKLSIAGHEELPVANRFFRQSGAAETLAVIFPGLNYTCDMPLLYYPARLLAELGADVLQLHTDYTGAAFQSQSRLDQVAWMGQDALAAVKAGQKQRPYSRLVLVGKSIGTLVLAYLVAQAGYANATTIWLTPLLRQPWLVQSAMLCTGPALFVAGSGDMAYDQVALNMIQEAISSRSLIIDHANHSLEIQGDLPGSIRFIYQLIETMSRFLAGNPV
jgi:hypothetical protein